MQAMILAAGAGQRMGKLTASTPKPLLKVGGVPIIIRNIEYLKSFGVIDIVINLHYLGELIVNTLGDGSSFGTRLSYSWETTCLDTGGGIKQALENKLLAAKPFIVLSADVLIDFDLHLITHLSKYKVANLVTVTNPPFHTNGDFEDQEGGRVTYANLGLFDPTIFLQQNKKIFALGEILKDQDKLNQFEFFHHNGLWINIGTPQELEAAELIINHKISGNLV